MGNYLRVRGEYTLYHSRCVGLGELPPRARRILGHTSVEALHNGTTSACAENTLPTDGSTLHPGNYLRVRGEYPISPTWVTKKEELPPRARRIQIRTISESQMIGTTSACAENTNYRSARPCPNRNYLRVRGEYGTFRLRKNCFSGTTSACAENTTPGQNLLGIERNYLRVRGEYFMTLANPSRRPELPPRARRIPTSGVVHVGVGNYLRVRGEYN